MQTTYVYSSRQFGETIEESLTINWFSKLV